MIPSTASCGKHGRGAGAAVLLWLSGLYVLPLLHNVDHKADHEHGPQAHGAEHDHHRPPEAPERRTPVPIDSDHGSGSILHFAAAALGAQELPAPEAGPVVALLPLPSPRPAPSLPRRLAFVRGPPDID